jgi:hypothetical protein
MRASKSAKPLSDKLSNQEASPGYKWKVLSTVMFGFFMILLDITVINVAFPDLRQEFSANLNEAQWIISEIGRASCRERV